MKDIGTSLKVWITITLLGFVLPFPFQLKTYPFDLVNGWSKTSEMYEANYSDKKIFQIMISA